MLLCEDSLDELLDRAELLHGWWLEELLQGVLLEEDSLELLLLLSLLLLLGGGTKEELDQGALELGRAELLDG